MKVKMTQKMGDTSVDMTGIMKTNKDRQTDASWSWQGSKIRRWVLAAN